MEFNFYPYFYSLMKKAMAIIFAVFYLLVTVGMAVQVHYCSGEIASVQLFSEANSCCDEDGACSSNCCHYASKVIQFEEQQTLPGNLRLNMTQTVADLAAPASVHPPVSYTVKESPSTDNASLPPPNEPVWLLHCSLVYYG